MNVTKSMGLYTATSIGVGAMVGAGIFSFFGTAVQISGSAVYVSFIIAGLIALLNAYSYAKMGVRYPSAGGPVEFLLKGFGDGILSGGLNLLLWVGYVFGLSLYAKGFSYYAVTFLPPGSAHIWANVFSTAIILVFTATNFIGAKAVGKSELFIVSIKVGILLLFAAAGILSHGSGKSLYFYLAKFQKYLFRCRHGISCIPGIRVDNQHCRRHGEPRKNSSKSSVSECCTRHFYLCSCQPCSDRKPFCPWH
jgi:amino acid transporter